MPAFSVTPLAKAQVDKLTQSVLAKAFRGALVPTEAELARREGRSYETEEQLTGAHQRCTQRRVEPGAASAARQGGWVMDA